MNLHWASALRVQGLGEIWPWAGTHITSNKSTEVQGLKSILLSLTFCSSLSTVRHLTLTTGMQGMEE